MRKPATACLKSNLHVIRTMSMTHRGNSIRASSCSWPAPRFSPRSPSFGHGAWRRASCNICSDLDLSLDSLVFDACLNGHYSRSGRTELPGNVGGDEEDADHIPYRFFRRLTPHGPLHGMYEGDMRFGKHSSLPGQCRTYSPCVLFS